MLVTRARKLFGRESIIVAAVFIALAGAPVPGVFAEEAGTRVLTIAKSDTLFSRAEKQLRPLAAYLAERLAGDGVEKVRTFIASDAETLSASMREGEVDLVFDSPCPVMVCQSVTGASPFLLGISNGLSNHHGRLFVRKESGVENLAGLGGRTVAVESRSSLVEFFLPKLLGDSAGLQMKELPGPVVRAAPGEVGYVFAGSPLNVSAWVFYGRVDAGFISSDDWQEQGHNPEAWRREFTVIHETPESPRLVVAARKSMDGKLLARLAEELTGMHRNPLGAAALKAYRIDSFAELPPGNLEPFEKMSLQVLRGR